MSMLREAFIEELKDIYDAEKQLLKALPKMAKAAENDELRMAFEEHKDQTGEQIQRLENVFAIFDQTPKGKKCKGMAGLIEEAQDSIADDEGDAALIASAQKAEHYEISAYGTLIAWATALQEDEAIDLLQETLEEESETDERLTSIAETVVNELESGEDENGEDEEEEEAPRSRKTTATSKRK